MTILEIILLIVFPPLPILLRDKKITQRFWINLVLTLLGYIPGLIHGAYTLLKNKNTL